MWVYKIVLWYNGTNYLGLQKQKSGRTVAQAVETALAKIAGQPITVTAAGRTDSGVHAQGQVLSLRLPKRIPAEGLKKALNSGLPSDCGVVSVEESDASFHAQKSAIYREYMYLFAQYPVPMSLQDFITPISFTPEVSSFPEIEKAFLGTHDFSAFKSTGSTPSNPVKTVELFSLQTRKLSNLYTGEPFTCFEFRIGANSFLYHMVRHIVGDLFDVFRGKQSWEAMVESLHSKQKKFHSTLAPAKGLCLVNVTYK
ncbi:MAG: tRNA pseudouridine(38-40) synthase TruA [bacterium]|nr:tRNA pseudouridine(38-40) synthase TruA [bacterium]